MFASVLPDIGTYKNFVLTKELWVCSSIAFPVDISYDAFNVDFKTLVQGRYGYFIQVKPGMHSVGSELPNADAVIVNPAKGVLNPVGKPAGIYEYIFVATADFCGMKPGEQAIVRVYIVPQLTGFPVLTNICPGSTETVDFDNFIPPEIKYFIEEMEWTITYRRNNVNINHIIQPNLNTVGNNVYEYTINDALGAYRGKYTAMQGTVYACPEDSAFLTHTVRIREGEEYAIPNKEISLCLDNLLLVPETSDKMRVNLFGYLGASVKGGVWEFNIDKDNIGKPEGMCKPDSVTGKVDIPVDIMQYLPGDSIVFRYSYKNCIGHDTFTLLTLKFQDNFKDVIKDREKDVCRNLVSGIIDLPSTFGFSVPLTAGVWYERIDGRDSLLLSGSTDISNRKSGSLYTFRFDVSSAVDKLCGVEGSSAIFGLRIRDVAVTNAAARICKKLFENNTRPTVDLSKYVPGLNDTAKIDSNTITWWDSAGMKINDPARCELALNESQLTSTSPNVQFKFNYEVKTECGPYTGSLYITAVDTIPSADTVTIRVCYTDSYASHIDLAQALGIAGLKGRFELENTDPLGLTLSSDVFNNGILNVNADREFELRNNSVETYIFGYIPEGDECVSNNVRVKVVVTRDHDKYGQK
jgi:hypothetical protein